VHQRKNRDKKHTCFKGKTRSALALLLTNPLAKSAILVYNQIRNRRIPEHPTAAQLETSNQLKIKV